MVSAPIYVAKKQMSYLRIAYYSLRIADYKLELTGPREQNRGLWVGYKLKTKKYEKCVKKNAENDSGAPWRMKRGSN